MLYIESRRLGRKTALGFLMLAFVIVAQVLLGGWGLYQMHREMSSQLVSLSDFQVESLELKARLNEMRKLEKDILLSGASLANNINNAETRWQSALDNTLQQVDRLLSEVNESQEHAALFKQLTPPPDQLKSVLEQYAHGVRKIAGLLKSDADFTPQEANSALTPYKKIIANAENALNRIVDMAEEHEEATLEELIERRNLIILTLGGTGLLSLLCGGLLSFNVTRTSLAISRSLEHQALHDTLTGLFNRRGLATSLSADNVQRGALAYLDLDRFKLINDLCGHTAGDDLLVDLTARLSLACEKYGAIIARVGGDEFAIWLPGATDLASAHNLADQLVALIEQHPFEWLGQPMTLGASVGLALAEPGYSYRELVSRADAACRLAKLPGSHKVLVYEESDPLLQQSRHEERWAAKLPQLILENRFCLYGQRIIPLQDNTERGHVEILLRGLDKNNQPVAPGDFLSAAERFGLMPKIDRWVIETLLKSQLEENCEYAINLSGQTLMDRAYLPRLESLLRESGKAHLLSFEITESAAMSSIDTAREYIHRLRALGCRFALDDFGSGFSSFAYLRDLQVDFLKIDGSLIHILGRHDADAALVRAIVQMAQTLGLKTIAEFVETREIADQLREIGVDYGQGYGLHKPEPLSAMQTRPNL